MHASREEKRAAYLFAWANIHGLQQTIYPITYRHVYIVDLLVSTSLRELSKNNQSGTVKGIATDDLLYQLLWTQGFFL